MTLPDKADIDTYGGVLQNYGDVEDPTTDIDASAFNECRADVAALGLTGARAIARFLGVASGTPGDPASGFVHTAVWGELPAVKPEPARSSAGIYTLTWPATIEDALGTTRTVNLQLATAWVELTGATRYTAHARVTSANVVEVRVFDDSGLADPTGLAIVCMAW